MEELFLSELNYWTYIEKTLQSAGFEHGWRPLLVNFTELLLMLTSLATVHYRDNVLL